MMNKRLLKESKYLILICFFCILIFPITYGQKDTLDAIYIDVVTENIDLIEFSQKLENLPKGNTENLFTGVELFKALPENVKDTALLIFIYQQRAFWYFDCPENRDYADLYDEYSPNMNLIKEINEKELKSYGFELEVISDGDIVSSPIAGFIETQVESIVNGELKKFLAVYSKSEMLDKMFFRGDYDEYLKNQSEYLILLEDYLVNYDFVVDQLKVHYYYDLVYFVLKNSYRTEYYGYEGYHFSDSAFVEIFDDFVSENPNSKATWFINTLRKTNKELDIDIFNQILNKLSTGECINEEECCEHYGVEYHCKEEYFNYDDFKKNLQEIIRCYKEGECKSY